MRWHDQQWEVFHDPARFKVVFAGRRWGKTRGAIQRQIEKLYYTDGGPRHTGRNKLGWWVSLTSRQAKIAYRYFRRIFYREKIIIKENKSELTFELVCGNRLEFRSAEIPENLRGDAPDHLVMDEAPYMEPEVWSSVLRPALMDSEGTCDFIGTPNGMNWMHELWLLGRSGQDAEWKSWTCSTFDNPYIKQEEIKKAIARMPEIAIQQEIYAIPMTSQGMVFRSVDTLSTLSRQDPKPGKRYEAGIDLAKYKDWTVVSVIDPLTGDQVDLDAFNKIDWSLQVRKISVILKRWNNAHAFIDSTGVGDPIFEALKRAGLRVSAYQLNQASKKELIDNLILKLDKQEIRLIDDDIQKGELKSYAYELTSSGHLKTNAPSGKHDDYVIALALSHAGSMQVQYSGLFNFYEERVKKLDEKQQKVVFERQQEISKIFNSAVDRKKVMPIPERGAKR